MSISSALANIATKMVGFGINLTKSLFGQDTSSYVPPGRPPKLKKESEIDQKSPTQMLGGIFELMQKKEQENKKEKAEQESLDKRKYQREIERTDALIKALSVKRKTVKKQVKEKKVSKEEKPAPTAPTPTPSAPTKPTQTPTPTAPAPTVPAPTATKVSPPAPIIPGGAAAGVAITGTAAALVASKIARGESRGESKESYTQSNIVGKEVKQAQIVKGNIDVTTGKPFDKSLTEMTIGEVIDLGKRRYEHYKIPDPKNPGKFIYRGGSAMGKYQFIPGTLAAQAKKLYGEGWSNHLFDSRSQEDLNISFIKSNEERLKKAGIPVTDASLYMMHFFGNEKQTAQVINGDEETKMSQILGDFASKQNPGVAKLTVGEYKNYLRKKGFDFQIVNLTESKPLVKPIEQDVGAQIEKSTKENIKAKETLKEKQNSKPTTTNIVAVDDPVEQENLVEKSVDDRNIYLKKSKQ